MTYEIGGSDAPVVLGLSPHETPLRWWARTLGLLPPIEETEEMRWGQDVEPLIVQAAIAERKLHMLMLPALTLWGTERKWQRATPDAVAVDDQDLAWFVEAKALRTEPPDEPLPAWLVQVQHQLDVYHSTGDRARGLIAAWGALTLRTYEVEYHPAFAAEMVRREEAMLALLEKQEPPPVTAADNSWLAKVYPMASTLERRILPPEAAEWDAACVAAKAHVKRWQAVQDLAEAQIKAAMGTARVGVLPSGAEYTWTTTARRGWTVPDGTVRTLRRKGKGNGAG